MPLFRASPRGSGKPADWGDTIQGLIEAGHRLEDIKHYTLPQLRLFSEAVADQQKLQARLALKVARAASADDKSFNKVWKEFE